MISPQLVVGAALALTTTLTASGLVPAAAPEGGVECGWRITAVHVLAELTGDTSPRAEKLRRALLDVGANKPGFIPAQCYEPGTGDSSGSGSGGSGGSSNDSSDTGTAPSTGNGSGSNDSGGTGSGGTGSDPGNSSGDGTGSGGGAASKCTTTAADTLGWGEPKVADEFEGTSISGDWNAYDGPGHGGNGRRTPDAISVADGQLTITGSENGDAGGMAWSPHSQQYGRWEGCAQSPAPAASSLHTLFLLWPTAENWPEGGEVDFMEISDGTRQKVEGFLHYGSDNSQTQGSVEVDATEWHAFAVEWTPDKITYLVDGEPWFTDDDKSHNPPGPMHLTIQLDYFGGDTSGGAAMHVDWVRQYELTGGGASVGVDVSAGQDGVDAGADVSLGGGDSDSTGQSSDDRSGGGSGGDSDRGGDGGGDRGDSGGGSRGGD
ncbi:family 16 glycosylhydrolase [Pseudonocardia sp. McavD-2-B]|uniref:glycoside hydrolase family 16 protein n=1 Tax=Pseudonocardia sp. McavD-2-B TaxID=2954499 RepID=UPI002098545E|nr:family 16 glycosylhydrolase [Pseudonocardia sp. McavD-2-B]MCO7192315.1 glycoside hydrolase family 16 protein [Pseudonocardia sp. McavD-2-B]